MGHSTALRGKKNGAAKIRASEIYLRAAQDLDAGKHHTALYAVMQYSDSAHTEMAMLFRDGPTGETVERGWDRLEGSDGVLALCFMAAMVST
jgi:hypothetical protein